MMELISNSKTAMIEKWLLEKICSEDLKAGDRILSEPQLIRKFDVSRITVKRALNNLKDKGILYRVRGKGTFIKSTESLSGIQREINLKRGNSSKLKQSLKIAFLYFERANTQLEDSFHFASFLSANKEAANRDHSMNLVSFEHDLSQKEISQQLSKLDADAFIITSPSGSLCNAVLATGVPAVLCGTDYDLDIDCVCPDDEFGAKEMTNYLLDLGHERIAFVDFEGYNAIFKSRRNGYIRGYEHRHQPVPKGLVFSYKGPDSINDLILKKKPTAIFAANDAIALEIAESLRKLNIKVPEDISLVGFDNRPSVIMKMPDLTTMKVPNEIMGRLSIQIILNRLENLDTPSFKHLVRTELIKRNTCAKINKKD